MCPVDTTASFTPGSTNAIREGCGQRAWRALRVAAWSLALWWLAVVSVAANRCPGHALADPRTDLLRPPGTTDAGEAVVWQALAAAAAFGGATAATVQAGANLLRERAAVRAEAEAHSAQARLSARVLTAVPLAFAGWSATASATFRRALASPPGVAAASAGLCLNLLGWWWMRRIVRAAS